MAYHVGGASLGGVSVPRGARVGGRACGPLATQSEQPTGRLLLVSNRLPVHLVRGAKGLKVERSAGGLATGLRGPFQRRGGAWIGWPGTVADESEGLELALRLGDLGFVPVTLSADEVEQYYEKFSNGVLWPTFHYQIDRIPINAGGFEAYRAANEKFAQVVVEQYQPGDLIWIHDYQLMLLPAMVRQQIADAAIGFFLHIPFPSADVFSVLPWREDLLRGLLGADLIGFHTPSYLRHFSSSLRRVLGLEVDIDQLDWLGRKVGVGAFPMGVDARAWTRRAQTASVAASSAKLRAEAGEKSILLGIDRLDYTKGIRRRVLAIDRLLELHPEFVGRIRLIQVSVPSREAVDSYASFRREIDELVGRTNARWTTENWVPIHHLFRALPERQLASLYAAADIMLVTPLRDGMNLVAKEYVAARTDGDGVLILSEFAGASSELGDALHVNPYDIDALAARIHQALMMEPAERQARMRSLRSRVCTATADAWAASFINRLSCAQSTQPARRPAPLAAARAALRKHESLHLLFDYDGTLVPFAVRPELAAPDSELLELLAGIGARSEFQIEIVSGRPREVLERWFRGVPVGLHAEHGLWSRASGKRDWSYRAHPETDWRDRIRPLLEAFTAATPGSLIEDKTASVAWHYRLATADFIGERDFGEHQARDLRQLLAELLSNHPVQVVRGSRVVEIRPHGVSKASVAADIVAQGAAVGSIVAVGDDVTDEDLFTALPAPAITVQVGGRPSSARYQLADHLAVRAFVAGLATE